MTFELLLLIDHYNGIKIGGIPVVPTSLDEQMRREVCNDEAHLLLKILSLKQEIIQMRVGKSIMNEFIHNSNSIGD